MLIRQEHRALLACPLTKAGLQQASGGTFVSSCGFVYDGVDFRIPLDFSHLWEEGQSEFEGQHLSWIHSLETTPGALDELDAETAHIYAQLPLSGLVLDVGGYLGMARIQARIPANEYVSIDPIAIDEGSVVRRFPNFAAHYELDTPVTRLQANAEFLPFHSSAFDTVHMRSCLDHFAAPLISLYEAYRVLKPGGRLVVGMSLEGAYKLEGVESAPTGGDPRSRIRRVLKKSPRIYSIAQSMRSRWSKQHDHHVFHPTHSSLIELVKRAGFTVDHEVWQDGYYNVLYLSATRMPSIHPSR